MKRIIVMRHAHPTRGDDDFSRSLTPEGRNAAREAGEQLRGAGHDIDTVVCSAAFRAKETAEIVHRVLGVQRALWVVERLYLGSVDDYLEVLSELTEASSSALLVAHNPTISELAARISGAPVSMYPAHYVAGTFDVAAWRDVG